MLALSSPCWVCCYGQRCRHRELLSTSIRKRRWVRAPAATRYGASARALQFTPGAQLEASRISQRAFDQSICIPRDGTNQPSSTLTSDFAAHKSLNHHHHAIHPTLETAKNHAQPSSLAHKPQWPHKLHSAILEAVHRRERYTSRLLPRTSPPRKADSASRKLHRRRPTHYRQATTATTSTNTAFEQRRGGRRW